MRYEEPKLEIFILYDNCIITNSLTILDEGNGLLPEEEIIFGQ